ncbi:MAG TPA: hypothetical protein VFV75_12825 [Candidatus Polarisedimenticolaceae bacterium]|nr:hypothetical protein [Candidatus Polarisedimenticolaceae bacterium]
MVHALMEAHRVLSPDGLLVDLRPAAVHRRVYHVRGKVERLLGVTRERFDDERASDRAVRAVMRSGHFEIASRALVPCDRVTSSLEMFRSWLRNFEALQSLAPHAWLLRRAERAVAAGRPGDRIVVRAPLDLWVLRRHQGRE